MIEQTNKPLTYFAFYSYAGVAVTGLAVTCSVYSPSGVELTNGNAVEVGKGLYCFSLDSAYTTAAGAYPAVFRTTEMYVDCQDIPALWVVGTAGVDHLDADIDSRLATTGYTAPSEVDLTGFATSAQVSEVKDAVDAIQAVGGEGSIAWTYTVYKNSAKTTFLEGVKVWLTTDSAGNNPVAPPQYSDSFGNTHWTLDSGEYFVWRKKDGYTFENPVKEPV